MNLSYITHKLCSLTCHNANKVELIWPSLSNSPFSFCFYPFISHCRSVCLHPSRSFASLPLSERKCIQRSRRINREGKAGSVHVLSSLWGHSAMPPLSREDGKKQSSPLSFWCRGRHGTRASRCVGSVRCRQTPYRASYQQCSKRSCGEEHEIYGRVRQRRADEITAKGGEAKPKP